MNDNNSAQPSNDFPPNNYNENSTPSNAPAPYGQQQQPYGQPQSNNTPASYGQPQQPYGQSQQPYGQPQPNNVPIGYGQYGAQNPQVAQRVPGWRTVIPMHPLSIGETLDAAVRIIRFNPMAFIVFPLLITLVTSLVQFIAGLADGGIAISSNSDISAGALLLSLIASIVAIAGTILIEMAGTRVTLKSVRGQKLDLSDTFNITKVGLGRFALRYIGLMLLVFLITLALVLVGVLIGVVVFGVAGNDGPTPGTVALLVLLYIVLGFVAWWFILARLSVTVPVMIGEDVGPITALRRSWNLTRGSVGYLTGLLLVTMALLAVIGLVSTLILGGMLVAAFAAESQGMGIGTLVVTLLWSIVVSIFLAPFLAAVTNLAYVNMRFRRENFHQQLLYEAGQAR